MLAKPPSKAPPKKPTTATTTSPTKKKVVPLKFDWHLERNYRDICYHFRKWESMSEHELHQLVLRYRDSVMEMPLPLKAGVKIPTDMQEAMAQRLTRLEVTINQCPLLLPFILQGTENVLFSLISTPLSFHPKTLFPNITDAHDRYTLKAITVQTESGSVFNY